jgi:autotransporter-associated beta strand protein
MTLTANNSYAAGTTLNAGQLNLNNPGALGTGAFTIAGGAIDNTSGSPLRLSANNAQNWNGDFTFVGSSSLNLGTGAVTLNTNRGVTVNANTLTVGGAVSGAGFGLTKAGNGTLALSGPNTYSGATAVNAGELVVSTVSLTQGNYSVASGATLGVTNASSSSALVSNLTVAAGSALEFQNVNSTTTPLLAASNLLVNGGCVVKITGASGLAAGNNFPLASYAGALNGFANLQLQMPYGWRGSLVNSGNQISLANVAVVATTPPQAAIGMTNGLLQFIWPSDHTGWRLLMSTNLMNANWMDVSSNLVTTTNQMSLPLIVTNSSVFYRLVYP